MLSVMIQRKVASLKLVCVEYFMYYDNYVETEL